MATRSADGLSRRQLLRASLGAAVGLWLVELGAGTLGFLWPSTTLALAKVRVGTLKELIAVDPTIPIDEGFPAYVPNARAFVVLLEPARGGFLPGEDPTGDGTRLNVRALYQRCPHLGCRPNPCVEDFWFHCPCHQSRYDRLGTKPAGTAYGPAPRGMDRFGLAVDAHGVLTVDRTRLVLGPLPIALGQLGVIPPKVPNGCQ
ncbi:MAG: QcrA and Rieske domain-containing protein [Candidatus Limnocylindrales bacterium]